MSEKDRPEREHEPPTEGVVSGEAYPPEERTRVVDALAKKRKGATHLTVHDDSEGQESSEDGPERVHRAHAAGGGGSSSASPAEGLELPPRPPQRSRDLAERMLRERRRARDRKAERAAFAAVVIIFGGIGIGGYYLLNSGLLDGDPPTPVAGGTKEAAHALPPPERRTSAPIDETPDLPALRMMQRDGLTIAAEGIPEVTSDDAHATVGVLAAIETCRFAYGVWEFSPNKRFRFLTTCGPMAGQVLVGAYEIQGSRVRMSPLVDKPAVLVSEFEVEKPSQMITRVEVTGAERPIVLQVMQRITTLRGGLEGEGFRATYAPKNTLEPPMPGRAQEGQKAADSKGGSLADQLR